MPWGARAAECAREHMYHRETSVEVLLILHCRVLKSHFNACVDELTEHLNADVDNNGVLRELVWTDISEVLQRKIKTINAFKLNREAWAADGLIPFDRRVAVTLAAYEAEHAEDAAERLMRSVSIEPRTNEDSVTKQTLSTRYIVPRTSAKAQNSLRLAVDGLDEVTAHADRFDALVKKENFKTPPSVSLCKKSSQVTPALEMRSRSG